MKNTIYGTLFILCMIMAVGCIEGPTGHESDNWIGMVIFAISGIIFGLLAIKNQTTEV